MTNDQPEGLTPEERAQVEALADRVPRDASAPRDKATSTSIEDGGGFKTRHETAVCRQCGDEFRSIVTAFGGRELRSYDCDPCLREAQAGVPATARDPLIDLERIGLNVRRHGRLTLEQLEAGGAEDIAALRTWCDTVLALKPWQEVRAKYLVGPTGTGKTQRMAAMARYLLERGYPASRIVFDRGRALVTSIQDAYGGGKVDAVLDRRRKAGVWFFDDAGTEKVTPDAFRIVEDILDAREGHPTVWSSNDGPEDLVDRWADGAEVATHRFRSRLAIFEFEKVDGNDRRF